MVSPEIYREHIFPHDTRVLAELEGGDMHCCGDSHHPLPEFQNLSDIRYIDFGQPEMNDLDAAYAQARERKIALTRVGVATEELRSGAVLDRFPTGVALKQKAESHVQAPGDSIRLPGTRRCPATGLRSTQYTRVGRRKDTGKIP